MAANSEERSKKGPAKSFSLMVDRTTKVEAAIWPKELPRDGGEGTFIVYSVTFRRSYRDAKGAWHNPEDQFYRPHELPTLRYLNEKAYDWIMEQKMKSGGED